MIAILYVWIILGLAVGVVFLVLSRVKRKTKVSDHGFAKYLFAGWVVIFMLIGLGVIAPKITNAYIFFSLSAISLLSIDIFFMLLGFRFMRDLKLNKYLKIFVIIPVVNILACIILLLVLLIKHNNRVIALTTLFAVIIISVLVVTRLAYWQYAKYVKGFCSSQAVSFTKELGNILYGQGEFSGFVFVDENDDSFGLSCFATFHLEMTSGKSGTVQLELKPSYISKSLVGKTRIEEGSLVYTWAYDSDNAELRIVVEKSLFNEEEAKIWRDSMSFLVNAYINLPEFQAINKAFILSMPWLTGRQEFKLVANSHALVNL